MQRTARSGRARLVARVADDHLTVEQQGMTVVCEKHHYNVPTETRHLPHSQRVRWRHICVGCAYEQGYNDGLDAAADGNTRRIDAKEED